MKDFAFIKEEDELKNYTLHVLKMFLRTVKPWKKGQELGRSVDYSTGWNDCVKEMKKEGDRYIKTISRL